MSTYLIPKAFRGGVKALPAHAEGASWDHYVPVDRLQKLFWPWPRWSAALWWLS